MNTLPLPSNVASLRPYTSARSIRKGDAWIFLDANESPFTETVRMDSWPAFSRYPDPTADALRDAIAAYYGLARGNLIMANGSDELLDLLVRSFVRPGRKVVGLSPSYGMYRVAAESNGKCFVSVPLQSDCSADEDALFSALDTADLLFLCSPNNPTGSVLPLSFLERVLRRFPGCAVVDEAYGEFADAAGIPSA
ncbi:MAG: aminotransferase class I/II-fold pyridoxal phosphate-dependent enzyme, partial [Candidatus Peribacteraceae bacterium]|nr:aminotransferase class I/II-fold pyridoxal phosphate-dependent enzyme [Candidatus Peribacteraceae bacterium]